MDNIEIKKPTSNRSTPKPKPLDFSDSTENITAPSALEIAKAVGEGLAKQLGNLQKVDTSSAASVAVEIERKTNVLREKQAKFAKDIAEDVNNYVDVMVPTIYAQFQPSFVISINGCTVKVPADGRTRKLHIAYATELWQRLRYLDKKIENMRANGSIRELSSIV